MSNMETEPKQFVAAGYTFQSDMLLSHETTSYITYYNEQGIDSHHNIQQQQQQQQHQQHPQQSYNHSMSDESQISYSHLAGHLTDHHHQQQQQQHQQQQQQQQHCDGAIQINWSSSSTHQLNVSASANSGLHFGASASYNNQNQTSTNQQQQQLVHGCNIFSEQSQIVAPSTNRANQFYGSSAHDYDHHLNNRISWPSHLTTNNGSPYNYGYYEPHQNHYQSPLVDCRHGASQEDNIENNGGYNYHNHHQHHNYDKNQLLGQSPQPLVSHKISAAHELSSSPANWLSSNNHNNQICSSSDLCSVASLPSYDKKEDATHDNSIVAWTPVDGTNSTMVASECPVLSEPVVLCPSNLVGRAGQRPDVHMNQINRKHEALAIIKHQQLMVTSAEPVASASSMVGNSLKKIVASRDGVVRVQMAAAEDEQQALMNSDACRRRNQCHVCGRNYARPSTLKTHLRTHTNERPFKCNVCLKTFSQAANLTAHQRVHTGERPFSCPTCGRQFSQSSSVITHLRTHSGERPYRCINCERTFSDSSTLTKHCRIHSGEKPYQCEYCPLNFSQSGNLSRHLKLHLLGTTTGGPSSSSVGGSSSMATNHNGTHALSSGSSSSRSSSISSSSSSSLSSMSSQNEATPTFNNQSAYVNKSS